jgi:hypothetical protein
MIHQVYMKSTYLVRQLRVETIITEHVRLHAIHAVKILLGRHYSPFLFLVTVPFGISEDYLVEQG